MSKPISKLENWFEVAKTGKFAQGDLTEKVFDEVISNFNPDFHEPPITLGHIRPEHNDKPAAGWIAGLKRVGNTLYAKAKQVAQDFDSAVQEGRYKKRSIGLRTLETGSHYLHHLAFLGAMPPAVKGLANVYQGAYSDDNESTQKEYSLSDERILKMAEFTEQELKARDEKIAAEAKAAAKKEFDEQVETAVEAKTEEVKAEAKAEVKAEVEKEVAAKAEAEKEQTAYSNEVESMLKEFSDGNKLSPAQIAILRPFLSAMNPKTEIEFSEKDEKGTDITVKRNALKVVRDLFSNSTVVGGDFADTKGGAKGDEANYSAEREKALEFVKADPKLSYSKALVKARAELKSVKK